MSSSVVQAVRAVPDAFEELRLILVRPVHALRAQGRDGGLGAGEGRAQAGADREQRRTEPVALREAVRLLSMVADGQVHVGILGGCPVAADADASRAGPGVDVAGALQESQGFRVEGP
ncbi:hypothetical protein J7E89_09240 [Streptomyces sp. ISL-100]|nr:hypothetical protein [Streptomyces sp. ISL-100]